MLRNYFTVALRHLLKNKTFSLINIFGLSIGVACCTLLALYIQDEFNYEKHFKDHNRIYRLVTTFSKEGNSDIFPRVSPPIATDLAELLPEIESAARVVELPNTEQFLVQYKDKTFYEKKGVLADSTFFEIFNYPFLAGEASTALDAPSSVVITEELSRKIFGDQSGIDELIIINRGDAADTCRVTGVIGHAGPSHLDASFYMTMRTGGFGWFLMNERTWAWNNMVSGYLKLKPNTIPQSVDAKLPALLEAHAGQELKAAGYHKALNLQALDDIRLYSDFTDAFGDVGQGSIRYIYILGSVGVFILLIACINFMNLTTARAGQRAGEVGIRKSMGAYRTDLIGQFLGESFTIVFISLLVAAALVNILLPVLNNATGKQLIITPANVFLFISVLIVIGIVTGVIAGSYPAFILSSFEPAKVLKGKGVIGDRSAWLRKGLVVFQFVITITLISSIFVIHNQLTFIREAELGFNDESIVMIPLRTEEASGQYENLRDEIRKISGVSHVSAANSMPSIPVFNDNLFYVEGQPKESGALHRIIKVDEGYFETLDIPLLEGRDLSQPADTSSYVSRHNKIIVNEASLKVYGIPLERAIGTKLFAELGYPEPRQHEIVGVVKDFHQFSLHQPITPLVFVKPADRNYNFIAIGLEAGAYKRAMAQIEKIWNARVSTTPFESQLLSDSVTRQYENDDRVNMVLTMSTILAIIISCMGLYALSIFVAERRIKEIGIRKVLGASVMGITGMLSKDFIRLVAIAFLIAAPLGYYVMGLWLENFAYKIELGYTVFILAGVVSFLIAWFTVGFESIRAAMNNPIKALRNE